MNIHPCLTPDQAEAVVDYGLNILPKPQLRHVQMPRITLHRRNQRADVNVRIPKLPHECTWRTRPLNLLRIKLRKMLNNHFRLRQNLDIWIFRRAFGHHDSPCRWWKRLWRRMRETRGWQLDQDRYVDESNLSSAPTSPSHN